MDLALAIWLYNPAAAYTLTADGTAILEWRSPTITQPTMKQLTDLWNAYVAQQQQAAADDLTARNAVITLVQSCVGITWTNLTAAQKQALIVALLYRAGALDKNLAVQPLADWLKR